MDAAAASHSCLRVGENVAPIKTDAWYTKVCFEGLRFRSRLSMSVSGRMTCVWLSCHSAVQKCLCLFYLKQPNGNLARHFIIKNIYIFECEWPNGNCHSTIHTQTQTETDGYRMHVQRELSINQSIKGTMSKVLVNGITVVEIQILSVFKTSSLFLLCSCIFCGFYFRIPLV